MPGGFHPFHAGHYSLYKAAKEKFPDADIYVAATNDTKTRPFPFEIKKKLAQLAGVDPNKFVQVKSPFKPDEITSKYDPEQDVVIFVRSEKDKNEEPIPGTTKKDGKPSYFQPYSTKNLDPIKNHAYMDYLPTIEFGPGIKSATEIRNSWPRLNDKQKLAMVMSLYPATQKNKKLAGVAVKMLDAGIVGNEINEEKEEKQDLNPKDILATPDEQEILSFVRKHYPEAPSTQAAFIKYVLHSLEHSKEDSDRQDDEIQKLMTALKKLEREVKNIETQPQEVQEATLINDPEQGHLIVPDGGMGTWDEQSLLSNLVRKFASMAEMIKEKRYSNLYHSLYKAGVIENMLKALVQYEKFKEKQGNRPLAKGKQVDISESTDYISEK